MQKTLAGEIIIILKFFLRKKYYYLGPELCLLTVTCVFIKQIFTKQILNMMPCCMICFSFSNVTICLSSDVTIFLLQQYISSPEHCVVSESHFKLQVFPTTVRYSLVLASKPKV